MTNAGLKIDYQYNTYFLTLTVVGWVNIFDRLHCKQLIIDSLKFCIENKGLIVYAYVLMTNHIHLVAAAKESSKGLSYILGDFKKFTSREMTLWMLSTKKESRRHWMLDIFRAYGLQTYRNENFQIWTHYNHPVLITSTDQLFQKIDYIHANPVKAGIVRRPEDYIYSSASNYHGCPERALDVTLLDYQSDFGVLKG